MGASAYDEIAEWYDIWIGADSLPEDDFFGAVAYHRTLSTDVNTLVEAGLTIEQLAEPHLTGRHARRRPVWTEVPGALVVPCRKAT